MDDIIGFFVILFDVIVAGWTDARRRSVKAAPEPAAWTWMRLGALASGARLRRARREALAGARAKRRTAVNVIVSLSFS